MTFFSYLSIAVRYGRGMFKACNGLELFVTAPFFFRWCWGDMGLLESIFLLEHVNISNFLLDNGIVHCLSNKMMHSYCDTISFLITLFLISASNYNLILMGKTFPQPPSILRRISAYGDFKKKKKILNLSYSSFAYSHRAPFPFAKLRSTSLSSFLIFLCVHHYH